LQDQNKIEKFLENFIKSLEISDSAKEKAEKRYESIGNWLSREESVLVDFKPEFYSQGSIRLGTTIKPLNEDGEYDLDAVCLLSNLRLDVCTQKNVKKLIGHELRLYVKANNFNKPLDEGKRCWTLEYSDSAQFHLDILPSIPDEAGFISMLESSGITMDSIQTLHTSTAIAITDNQSSNYSVINENWNKSNPKGYHEWFKKRCVVTQVTADSITMKSANESVEEIPIQPIKLPLQKVIMILKRHRDVMFENDTEHKPISIIITTLSARAYKGTESLENTLHDVINGIERKITCDIDKNCVVLNPINPSENFADKWADEPIKKDNFFKWLIRLKNDYNYLISNNYIDNKLLLENSFGKNTIQSTYKDSLGIKDKLIIKAKKLLSLTHVQKPKWTMNIQYNVYITCKISKDGMLQKQLQSNEAIEKNWSLRFEAKIENIGSGRKFYWQVANSGEEAREANCLRGDLSYDGIIEKGKKSKNESTSYTGSHFVRCFIIQNNICVAVSEPFIVNIT